MLFLICLILSLVIKSDGHGRLLDPPGRATAWRYGFETPIDYQDNEQFCGGRQYQHDVMGGNCGVCGDKYDELPRPHEAGGPYATGTIVKTYRQGQTITVTIQLTQSHKGYFEFRLCPVNDYKVAATEKCLETNVLKQTNGKIRFNIDSWDSRNYDIDLQLPADLTCSQCVLQWKYVAGNNWGCWKTSISSRWLLTPRARCCTGCGNEQEEFYGCADVTIKSDYNPKIPTTTTKRTTNKPTTTTTTTTIPTTTTTRRTTKQKPTTTAKETTSKRTTTTPKPTKYTPAQLGGSHLCSFFCKGKASHFCPKECRKGLNAV